MTLSDKLPAEEIVKVISVARSEAKGNSWQSAKLYEQYGRERSEKHSDKRNDKRKV